MIGKDRLRFAAKPKLYEREVRRREIHFPPKPLEPLRYAVFPRPFAGGCVLFFNDFPQAASTPVTDSFLFAASDLSLCCSRASRSRH